MTREELKKHCEKEIARCEFWSNNDDEKVENSKIYQEHKLVLELLKQDPCEDCVSREAVLNEFYDVENLYNRIKQLPPVTPKQRTGKWITWKEAGNYIPSETRFECSECHDAAQTLCNGLDLLSPFCPNCGAKMEGKSE